MNTYWLCLSLSVCFRFSWAQNDRRNFGVVEFEENMKSLKEEFVNENMGEKVLEMSTPDPVMITQMSIIEEKNGPNSENAKSPQISRTNTVLTEVKERKKHLLSLFSRRKNILEREPSFSTTWSYKTAVYNELF
jgi:hypothetical protein